jgi:hypothetical protein
VQNCLRIGPEWGQNGQQLDTNVSYVCVPLSIFGNLVMEHDGGLRHAGKGDLEALSTNPVSEAALRAQETSKKGKT